MFFHQSVANLLSVVRQLCLLFLQLYKSEQPSVRPDEELAYLAITRPEVDAIVEPPQPEPSGPSLPTLDSIPNMPSPSSTRVATPAFSDDDMPNTSSPIRSTDEREDRQDTILGKRASTDRDDLSSRSSAERVRHKTEDFEEVSTTGVDSPMELDKTEDDYEVIGNPEGMMRGEKAMSPSGVTDIAALNLKPNHNEGEEEETNRKETNETVKGYEPPSVLPPLPVRPAAPTRKDTLASGLRFGLQQDSAEVLINVLTQLETAFDPAVAEDGVKGFNLISE